MRGWLTRGGAAGLAAGVWLGSAAAEPPAPATPAPPAAPAQPAPTTATVNGEPIPLARVDAVITNKLGFGPLAPAQTRQLRTEVVADLIDDVLLRQFLRQNAPKVEPAEVEKHVAAFTESLNRRGKTLAAFLKETHQTAAELRDTWTTLLQLNGYLRQRVSDEQLKAYYAANKDYFDGAEVRVSRIVLRIGPTTPPAEKAAAKEKLRAVRADIAAGKLDFATAAKRHSHSPTAGRGGDIGFIPRKGGLEDEAFSKAAFALKVDELSDVVETEFGLHLLTVTERKPGTPSAFEACVEDVRDTFAEDFRIELVAKLRKQAQIQVTLP